MRITLVVLLCCVTVALAYPTSVLLDTQTSELTDRAFAAENYDDIPEALRIYIMQTIKNRPRPVAPNPIRDTERGRFKSKSDSRSESRSSSSSRKRMYESIAEQEQVDVPLKSFKEYLARFMQGGRCPFTPDPGCSDPEDVDICGNDDREIILNPNVVPNLWICRIIVDGSSSQWTGTGFKVKISPDVGRTVIFTAAHVIRDGPRRYVPRVRIQCPGEPEVTVHRNTDQDMYMAEPFFNRYDWNYDYGYITYPGNSNTGFGFQGFVDRAAFAGTDLHTCGYPSNQDRCKSQCIFGPANSPPLVAKQYCDEGGLTNLRDHKIYVDADIDGGESGGPLYDATLNNYVAVGILSLPADRCPEGRNFQRLTSEALYEMFTHIGGIDMNYRLRGSHNVYLHMDGAGLNSANRIGGSVYAGLRDNIDDTFKIFPIKQSSSNQPDAQLVAIRSATQDKIYLRLDGAGVTSFLLRGGGTANCRYTIDDGAMETFHKETEPDGQVAFRSTTFNNVYLRLDHWHVHAPGDQGEVNAQFGKFTLETNHLETFP